MIISKTKDIDGNRVEVTQFAGREGFKIKAKLMKIFAPSLAELVSGINKKDGSEPKKDSVVEEKEEEDSILDSEISTKNLSKALEMLSSKLSEDDFLNLCLRLMKNTRITITGTDGQESITEVTPAVFDMVFAGNFGLVYKIVFFVLEVNYGNFLSMDGIGKIAEKLRK